MRFFSLLTAALVAAVLYGLVMERDRLMAFVAETSPVPVGQPDEAEAPLTEEAAEAEAEAPPEASDEDSGAIRVLAMRSEAQMIDTSVLLRGETEALRLVDVLSETAGKVISEPLRKGAFVTEGEVLCELDPGTREASLTEAEARLQEARARVPEAQARVPEAEAQVASARAGIREAEINDTAAARLSQDGFASDTRVAATNAAVRRAEAELSSAEAGLEAAKSGLESARAAVRSAEAAVARASEEIDNLTIRAPFEGLLESDTAELGALLQPGAPCATILQLDPIKVVGFAPETEVGRIEVGAPATARLTGGTEIDGRVTFVSRAADSLTRTFRVEVTVENPALALSAGQTAELRISADGVAAHLLPQSALTLDDAGDLGVRTVTEDETALFIPVTVLRDTVEGVYAAGLPEQVDVITLGQEYVTDGVPVRPTFEEIRQ